MKKKFNFVLNSSLCMVIPTSTATSTTNPDRTPIIHEKHDRIADRRRTADGPAPWVETLGVGTSVGFSCLSPIDELAQGAQCKCACKCSSS
eukprot:9432410-Pyramimonas_sp.AAC.1